MIYKTPLKTGEISVITNSDSAHVNALFAMAERRNPKRAFLFVSKVLGRHIPVAPSVMRQTFEQLAAQMPSQLNGPVLFVGMAETAVGLAAGLYQTLRPRCPDSLLLNSTRHVFKDRSLLCRFREDHSHATEHFLYWPTCTILAQSALQVRTLVLVDDECTTGNTFSHALNALQEAGLRHLEQVITVTLTDWSENALSQYTPLPVTAVSLLKGRWHWQPKPDAVLPTIPKSQPCTHAPAALSTRQDWGRFGLTDAPCAFGEHLSVSQGERILVLGTNEFVWPAFLLAERLEKAGACLWFSSTTVSPIMLGNAIESVLNLSDPYGLGRANFVYNVQHLALDRIILCMETAVEDQWISALKNITPHVEILHYE